MGYADRVGLAEEINGPFCAFLYGPPGVGKTVFASYAPAPLLVQIDYNGARSLKNHPECRSVPVFPKGDGRTATLQDCLQLAKDCKRNSDEFLKSRETIILDTWTRLRDARLQQQVRELGADRKGASEYEYKVNNEDMADLLDHLRQAGKNIILCGHVKEEKDKEGTVTLIRPAIPEGNMSLIRAQTDSIFYMTCRTQRDGRTERTIRTLPHASLIAKNRFGHFPVEMKDPDPTKFWASFETGVW